MGAGGASFSALQRLSLKKCHLPKKTRAVAMQGPTPAQLCVSKPSPSSVSLSSPWMTLTSLNHLDEAESQQPITVILMALFFFFKYCWYFSKGRYSQSFTLQSVSGTCKCALRSVNRALEPPEPRLRLKCCLT